MASGKGRGRYNRQASATRRHHQAQLEADRLEKLVDKLKPVEIIYGEGLANEDLDVIAEVLLAAHHWIDRKTGLERLASCLRKSIRAVDVGRGKPSKPEVLADNPLVCVSCGQKKEESFFRLGPSDANGRRRRNRVCTPCVNEKATMTRSMRRPKSTDSMIRSAQEERQRRDRERKRRDSDRLKEYYQANRETILAKRRAARLAKKESGE